MVIKMKINITVGDAHYTATLNNNDAAAAFYSMLPLTPDMSELNGSAKYFYMESRLPSRASCVRESRIESDYRAAQLSAVPLPAGVIF